MPFGLGIFNRNNAINNRQAAIPSQRATRFFGAVAVFFGCGTDDVMPINVSFTGEEDAEDDSRLLNKRRSASLNPLHGSQSNLNSVKNASETVESTSPENVKKGKIIGRSGTKTSL